MMGQILRIKYRIDSSSISCILEVFFDNIYSMYFPIHHFILYIFCLSKACDGRLVYPHELKLLSNDKNLFVFYAVMMDVRCLKIHLVFYLRIKIFLLFFSRHQ